MSKSRRLNFDAILSSAGTGKPGYLTWFDRLDEQSLAELNRIKSLWVERGKKPPAATLARAIIAHCKQAGIEIAGETQVSRWLRNQS